jgi:hypothetical protein
MSSGRRGKSSESIHSTPSKNAPDSRPIRALWTNGFIGSSGSRSSHSFLHRWRFGLHGRYRLTCDIPMKSRNPSRANRLRTNSDTRTAYFCANTSNVPISRSADTDYDRRGRCCVQWLKRRRRKRDLSATAAKAALGVLNRVWLSVRVGKRWLEAGSLKRDPRAFEFPTGSNR